MNPGNMREGAAFVYYRLINGREMSARTRWIDPYWSFSDGVEWAVCYNWELFSDSPYIISILIVSLKPLIII